MTASWFTHDGQHIDQGEYSPVTKSLYRAAVDAAQMFNGEVGIINHRAKWAVVNVGDMRVVIGK